jgi:addiction module RelB/DinJ family antitoxin
MKAPKTTEFRVRIEPGLLRKATAVAQEMGTTVGDVVRMLFAQMVKRRTIPFTIAADSPEEEALGPARRRAELWDEMDNGKPSAR